MKVKPPTLAGASIAVDPKSIAYRTVRAAQALIDSGSFDQALRHVDQLWRLAPEHAAAIGPVYGRLLLEYGGNADAALVVLTHAQRLDPRPATEALILKTLLRQGQAALAVQRLAVALNRFAVEPRGELAGAARAVTASAAADHRGWVGLSPQLALVGEVRLAGEGMLSVTDAGGAQVAEQAVAGSADDWASFSLDLPAVLRGSLQVRLNGTPIGGSVTFPPDFDLDGRSEFEQGAVSGWLRLGWAPGLETPVLIEDGLGNRLQAASSADPQDPVRRVFRVRLSGTRWDRDRLRISAVLPGERTVDLPDSPLLTRLPAESAPARGKRPRKRKLPRLRPKVDVVIPVYRGMEETLACIESVRRDAGAPLGDVVVIDDASPEPALSEALDGLHAAGQIVLLRNEANRGFAATVNRGLALHAERDAVVLNSDAIVHPGWLKRLQAAAYSAADIGTVTPLSNDGSIASYPRTGVELRREDALALDRLTAAANAQRRVELPCGVGFCLYLRRDCLEEGGLLDDAVFGRGYGEETDLCLRARQRGWRNVLAADTFVLHLGGRSFGSRTAALQQRAQRLLELRHPGFAAEAQEFDRIASTAEARRRLGQAALRAAGGRMVLLVTLALGGGVGRFVTERCNTLVQHGLVPLVLRPARAGSTRLRLEVELRGVYDLDFDAKDQPALLSLLRSLRLEWLEIHHFIGLPAALLESLRRLSRPYDVYVHDYAWICPRITLRDGSGSYCGEPPVAQCERCVRDNGAEIDEAIGVGDLRRRSGRWLSGARRVLAPSADTARRLAGYFDGLCVDVVPLQPEPASRAVRGRPSGSVRVAVLGAIGQHKGYDVLLACARDAVRRKLPLQYTVIGYTKDDAPLLQTGRVFVTGGYDDAEMQHLLLREDPHAILLPSVWPETWSYTLTHALESGRPVMCFEIGAMAERLKGKPQAHLLPLSATAEQINDRLLQIGRTENIEAKGGLPLKKEASEMSQNEAPAAPKAGGIDASVKTLAVSPGLYLFSIRTGTPESIGQDGLALPALHVSVGQGTPPDRVDFVPSLPANGNWLSRPGDALVVRANPPGAMLVVTTARQAGGSELAATFERLDGPRDASTPTLFGVEGAALPPAAEDAELPPGLRLRIGAHIRARGDLSFVGASWAGKVGRGHWIESFFVQPLESLSPQDIEYKALTASGFESPWLSNGAPCGTRGMAIPLVGFAVRLKSEAAREDYVCEYSGYFQSGIVVGPVTSGSACTSTIPNDPIEGIQVHILKREPAAAPPPDEAGARKAAAGISFGRYRDDEEADENVEVAETVAVAAAPETRVGMKAGGGTMAKTAKNLRRGHRS